MLCCFAEMNIHCGDGGDGDVRSSDVDFF